MVQTQQNRSRERKLAAYVLAGSALIATANQTHADLVSSGVQNVTITPQHVAFLDVTSNGTPFITTNPADPNWLFAIGDAPLSIDSPGVVFAADNPSWHAHVTSVTSNLALPNGTDPIFGANQLADIVYLAITSAQSFASSFTPGTPNQLLGLEFQLPGDTTDHFRGWVQLEVTEPSPGILDATIVQWAYNNMLPHEPAAGLPSTFHPAADPALPIPEPTSLALFALGAAGVAVWNRWRGKDEEDKMATPANGAC